MENFSIPTGYVQRAVLEPSNEVAYIGYSKLGELDSGSWVVKKVTTSDTLIRIYYAEGAWDDVLTLIYK